MKEYDVDTITIYSFSKGYGQPVPLELYDVVFLLLDNDIMSEVVLTADHFMDCLKQCIIEDPSFQDKFLDISQTIQDQTTDALATLMVNQIITFNIYDNTMCVDVIKNIASHDEKAYALGKLLQGYSKQDILDSFDGAGMNIIVMQTDTLGKDVDLSSLKKLGKVKMYPIVEDNEVAKLIKEADIVVTNKNIIGEEQLKDAPHVKLICLMATGYNNVDIDYCNQRGIEVRNVKGYSTATVAQHTVAMVMHLLDKNNLYDRYVKSGEYSRSTMFSFFGYPIHEITSLTWGIVGLGQIGQRVANIAEVMGAHVQYYSTSGQNNNDDYLQVDFDTLLETSDIITIHAPLNDDTYHLFNYDAMSKMKDHAYLVNVGRGPIVCEEDLVQLLNEGKFDGVGLDVYEQEPLNENSPLLTIEDKDKLLLTPHVAWGSIEARQRLVDEVYLNIKAFLDKEERNVIKK